MSGVFTKKFGRRKWPVSLVNSCRYSSSSHFSLRQVKYVYDWWNPTFASSRIIGRRVNASDRKTTSGSVLRISPSRYSQKFTGLVCGLSTRNTVTPYEIQSFTIRSTSA